MRFHRILFYLLILILPVQLGRHFWPDFSFVNGIRIDYLAPTIYFTDLIVFGVLISWALQNFKFKSSNFKSIFKKLKIKNLDLIYHLDFIIWILFIFLFVNIIFSSVSLLALIKSLRILELFFLAFYIAKEKPSLKITIYCLLFTVCYSSVIAWIQFINQSSIGGLFWFLGERSFNASTPGIALANIGGRLILRPYAVFSHPNILAGYLTVLLPFVLFLQKLVKPTKIIKIINFPILLLMLLTIFITFSRTAWIASSLIILLAILTSVKKRRKIIILLFAVYCLLFTFLFPPSSYRFQSLFTTDQQSFSLRQKLNSSALSMIRNHPLFGVGLNNFLPELPKCQKINSYQDLQPAHNIYLLILAEGGIAGFSIFIWVLVKTYLQIFNFQFSIFNKKKFLNHVNLPACAGRFRTFEHSDIRTFAISLTSILILGLFDHYFYTIHQTQLLFALILGFIFSLKKVKMKV